MTLHAAALVNVSLAAAQRDQAEPPAKRNKVTHDAGSDHKPHRISNSLPWNSPISTQNWDRAARSGPNVCCFHVLVRPVALQVSYLSICKQTTRFLDPHLYGSQGPALR